MENGLWGGAVGGERKKATWEGICSSPDKHWWWCAPGWMHRGGKKRPDTGCMWEVEKVGLVNGLNRSNERKTGLKTLKC